MTKPSYFLLPDLGEGLPDAEIVKWHVAVGDTVEVDQILVEVETAKAIVEVPSPQTGTIAAMFGQAGDIIHTGEPLLEFGSVLISNADPTSATDANSAAAPETAPNSTIPPACTDDPENSIRADSGTVVGTLKQSRGNEREDRFIIGAPDSSRNAIHGRATPAIRALAERKGVDLQLVTGSGSDGHITIKDIEHAALVTEHHGEAETLRGVRRSMAVAMQKSHEQVVPVTLCDDADIHDWLGGTDITIRLIRAIGYAARKSPALNGWFYGDSLTRRLRQQVDVAIAVDTDEGLFVPVLRNIQKREGSDLRQGLNRLREDVLNRTIPPEEMQGGTITLSNFGTIAGRYGNPVVVPPQIAIIGAGKIREEVVARNQQIAIRKRIPISLTFDHRAATGGEAARFLAALIENLETRE
ncbi:dihydrolipoamide acetyltransferase [Oleiphilus messinensis]|uniref:Dihydrolipoamide acetyltransferase component of pyruvate dehydrogenase complex n=1 Tax=Oleiphilus messinensis TaxID=141451 RepID=A0A1Y0I6B8_9GAMM|nr:dihydrolipoamide acetyltransferase family protein [Oleiphilus messinensis]ARU54943.1 dihydrolipoamide acetyltransferase [Oleiphilus messinensis]